MAITVKHNKVSTIPDTTDTSLIRPSDWNADHTLVGTIDVANGGTGASTLTGYVKGNGTSAMTAVATVPSTDITGLGTMSTQNATAVAITGGTINGTTIGATTPSSVNATTITVQTARVNGTGTNLFSNSEQFNNWTLNASTVTANSTTAPNGTSTADTLEETVATSYHGVNGNTTLITGLPTGTTYTLSVYAKANTRTWLAINIFDAGDRIAFYDLANGVLGTVPAGATATITSVGSGWYRCTFSRTSASSSPSGTNALIAVSSGNNNWSYAGSVGQSIYLWGAQFEYGSTANTYIPTTTTAVYGTPTLSFSGVSEIGLLSNGALYLQPAGTGALQAQATTSTTAGGNARGANAVDWQTSRGSAAQVASSGFSVVSGGQNNTASNSYTFVGGGFQNNANAAVTAILGGNQNQATQQYSTVVGGFQNLATGWYNFIGSGQNNSGTANAAVTTQSGTMNATTAVTLSGSNANIKVGQYITGTSIADRTYVAAISGTALTLSQAASGSSTSTLSFFTPHGVVVGGGNNQATGSYSFIGGGGDAGTAANRNTASGDWSFVGGGRNNIASGSGSFIGGGGYYNGLGATNNGNTASGDVSMVLGGLQNNIAGFAAFGIGGQGNTASGSHSGSIGNFGSTRGINGYLAFSPSYSPLGTFTSAPSQSGMLILARQTTDATATALTSNTSAAGTTNQVILPNNSAYFFTGEVISAKTAGGDAKGWTIEGVIKRGANAASTALVGTPTVTSSFADAGASTWAIAVTADTTNGGLRVTFTGQAATTIRTVAQIRTTEMTY
jgi:hypothetical protein